MRLFVADAQRQSPGFHRGQMRSAYHAGNVVTGVCQPDRKMTADGPCAENAYPHRVDVLSGVVE
jgi:hypothetical protein